MDHNLSAIPTSRQPYDPQKHLLRWQVIYLAIIYIPLVFICIIAIWNISHGLSDLHADQESIRFFSFLPLPFISVFFWQYLWYRIILKRIRDLRQRGKQAMQEWLSTSHAAILPPTLSLPCTIGYRYNRLTLFLLGVAVAPFVVIVSGLLISSPFSDDPWGTLLSGTPFYAIITILLATIIYPLLKSRFESPTLTLTDESITARYINKEVTIFWKQVRYFALIGPRKGIAFYELADDAHIITWHQSLERPGFLSLLVPLLRFQEQSALLGTLPLWIMAKTQYPLLDLRYAKAFQIPFLRAKGRSVNQT